MNTRRCLALFALVAAAAVAGVGAQMRVAPLDEEQGHVALGMALRHLGNTGIFMQATAHPDDENNALLVMLNRGQGYRTALATATRGNGGQNEIGPEIFEALGVLRTEELAAMHRFDGAEQYFTRAVDFGYSFSIEETFEKWGANDIVGDFVRLIRTVRPDVMLSLGPDGDGGGQHHQASAILAREAFKAAGDPSKFPEQLAAGLRTWQPRKFYLPGRGNGPGSVVNDPARTVSVNLSSFDPLLGKTYADIGTEARSMHKCQGMAQLLSLPGVSTGTFQLVESSIAGQLQRDERSLFDGVDTSIAGLAQFAGPRPPRELTQALSAVASAVDTAQRRFQSEGDAATLQPLLAGLRAVRAARAQARAVVSDETTRFEIEFRLRQKEREFQHAILLAGGIRIEALADDGVVTPGQPVRVSMLVANRGTVDVTVKQITIEGFDGPRGCALTAVTSAASGRAGRGGRGGGRGSETEAAAPISTLSGSQVGRCDIDVQIPVSARISEPYWHRAGEAGRYTFDEDAPFGLPHRPTPFYSQIVFSFAGAANEEVIGGLPVQYRYSDIMSGEKRSELLVVPGMSVRVSPEVSVLPLPLPSPEPPRVTPTATRPATPGRTAATTGRGAVAAAPKPAPPSPPPVVTREVRVTVVNDVKGAVESVVTLTVPAGWAAIPAQQEMSFTREDESRTVRFQVRPPTGLKAGEFDISATAMAGGNAFSRGYQVIEYPHIRRQHIYERAATKLKVLDVKTSPNLTVGYVMGVGDEVPEAIGQLGVTVTMLGPDDLAWGDLSRFGAIVTGVRAYERRDDLRANNSRLLEYVRNGGTLVVQYNKFEFNDAEYGPYHAQVSSNRVTDENAPVRILTPGHPILTTPNELSAATWSGWVQERGLYFLGEKDSRYRDIIALTDPFPFNPGEKVGALVETQFGRGKWIYVGLGLWRELPAGVPGAYQLLANLLSYK
jgi:LmbE family N-acetylglucosaminyl deacetylase